MATEQLTYEEQMEEIPSTGPEGDFPCAYCPEKLTTAIKRYNHERGYHLQEFLADSPDGRRRGKPEGKKAKKTSPRPETGGYKPVTISGVRMDTVHDTTRKFAETLDNVAPDMNPGKKKQIILAFDDIAYQVHNDPARLQRFLNNCGVSASQAEYIKMILLGFEDERPSWGRTSHGDGPGGTQAYTWDPATGRMTPAPIFLMGGQNSGGQNGTSPILLMPGWGQGSGNGEHLTRRDLEDYVDRVVEKLKPAPPVQESHNPGVRRYQRPVVGADQRVMVDPNTGQPLMAWVEEPVDPFGDTLNKLTNLGLIGKQEPPAPPSAQEIGEAVALQVQGLLPQHSEKDEELVALGKRFDEYIHRNELKEAERSGAQAALDAYQHQIQPYLDELKDLRGRTGLTDRQYELRHEEATQRNFLGAVSTALNGLRSDLQPLAIQNMVATMKTMGVSDNVINETLHRLPSPAGQGLSRDEEDVRAATMQKWVNE